jgi:hypothetical protein
MNQQANWRDEKHKNISERERVALAFESLADDGNSLALVMRYQARLQHDYQKILKSLYQMRATRAAEVKLPNGANPIFEHHQTIIHHGASDANIRLESPVPSPEFPATPPSTSPPVSPHQRPHQDDRNSTTR